MQLFRVMPFNRLEQVAAQEALAFVSYRVFEDDPHEASLIQALTTNDGLRDVFQVLKEHGEMPATVLPMIMAARSADASAYMQCWTRTPEHNLMWERYGDGQNAVRVRMTEAGFGRLPGWISSHEARYEDTFDIWKELQLVKSALGPMSVSTMLTWSSVPSRLPQSGVIDFRHSLTFKLAAYAHENEIRLMTPIMNDFGTTSGKPKPPPWVNSPGGNSNVTLVPIGPIQNVIASVMVGPQADDEFQRQVEAFCKTNGLEYEGKSSLRTRRYTGSKKIFTSDPDDSV